MLIGEEYGVCRCTKTCKQLATNSSCAITAADDNGMCCTCPIDMVRDDITNECISPHDCNCYDENGTFILFSYYFMLYIYFCIFVILMTGISHDANKVVFDECQKCQCLSSVLKCAPYCAIDTCSSGMSLEYDEDGCCFCQSSNFFIDIHTSFT